MCSNNKYIVVFIDYNVIGSIMKNTNFNIISIDRVNYCFINISVYLFIYLLDVYYILKYFNLVFDILLYFRALENDVVQIDNVVKPTFDMI